MSLDQPRRLRNPSKPELIAASMDGLALLSFVLIGRSAHDKGLSLLGTLNTLWPFASGLAIAWLMALRTGRLSTKLSSAARMALVTVAVGMVLRVVSGQGTALAFVLVAVGYLGSTMVGVRMALRALRVTSRL